MSVYAGPEINAGGLVLFIDFNNTNKSWKGEPVNNLASGNFFNGNANFTVNQTVTDFMPDGSLGNARELNAQTVVDANRTVSIGSYALTAGSTYTLSFYVKNISCTGFGGNLYSPTLGSSIAGITYPTTIVGAWVRVTTTFTVPTGSGSPVTVSPQVFRDGGFGLFRLCWLQLEERSFATPYTETTRTANTSLLDISFSKNIVTISDLTYAANTIPSFDGINDYMITNKTWNDMKGSSWNGQITLEGVLKTVPVPTNSAMGYFGFNTPGAYFKFMNTGNLFLDAGSTVPSRIITNCITSFSSYFGNWVHVCAVYDGTVKTYFNGVLQTTSAAFTLADLSPVQFEIGSGMGYYNFQGNIDNVKIYNRALTSSEISQNFNALRGRFGI